MRLRGRLLWAFSYLLLLAVVALAVPLAVNVERRARGDFQDHLGDSALVIAASIQQPLESADPAAELYKVVAFYGSELGARVIVTDHTGTLLVDSDDPSAARADYSNRPEIAQALEGRQVRGVRHSDDLGQDLLVIAAPVVNRGRLAGVVRLSKPTTEVDRVVRRTWLAIAAAGVAVLVAGLAIAAALASSLARPLRELEKTARRLGSGDLTARAAVERAPPDVAEVAAALNSMAADVETMVESQRAFVANASHQIRTPLTGLRLRLEAMSWEETPEAQHATAALEEVDRLNALVGDLLQLARVGVPAGEPVPVDLGLACRSAVERWKSPAAEHGHTLVTAAPGETKPVLAAAAPGDVDIVLDNLVENAIVYCDSGAAITLRASAEGTSAAMAVEDDGPGIAPEDLPHVLERFYRGRTGRVTPGTGLGLAIVGELARRWGGSVDVSSPGQGTRVTVRLPAAASAPPRTATVGQRTDADDRRARRASGNLPRLRS
jgi:signal transduction histidine kinase